MIKFHLSIYRHPQTSHQPEWIYNLWNLQETDTLLLVQIIAEKKGKGEEGRERRNEEGREENKRERERKEGVLTHFMKLIQCWYQN